MGELLFAAELLPAFAERHAWHQLHSAPIAQRNRMISPLVISRINLVNPSRRRLKKLNMLLSSLQHVATRQRRW